MIFYIKLTYNYYNLKVFIIKKIKIKTHIYLLKFFIFSLYLKTFYNKDKQCENMLNIYLYIYYYIYHYI